MDKFGVNVRKRKKRRTRKRLDEIRKRTFKIQSDDAVISNKGVKPTITNYMTSNRLTLMKKTIRSETMTRSLLSRLRQEKNRAEVILPPRPENKKVSNGTSHKESVYIDTKINSPFKNSSSIEQQKKQDSIILFSSSDSEKVTDLSNGVLSDSASSSSSVPYLLQRNRSLYDEFMNNIEKYICDTGSEFSRTENIFKHRDIFRTSPYENKLNIKNKESANLFVIDSDNSVSESSHEVSLEQLLPLPIFHTSPTSSLASSTSACYSLDSPEYLYYPHKLNQ